MASILRPLHVASGSKLVSWLGVAISSGAAVCVAHPGELGALIPKVAPQACAGLVILGGILAAAGKGVADRRKPPVRMPDTAESIGRRVR